MGWVASETATLLWTDGDIDQRSGDVLQGGEQGGQHEIGTEKPRTGPDDQLERIDDREALRAQVPGEDVQGLGDLLARTPCAGRG